MRAWPLGAVDQRTARTCDYSVITMLRGVGTPDLAQCLLSSVRHNLPAFFSSVAVAFPDRTGGHIGFGSVDGDRSVGRATLEYDSQRLYARDLRWTKPVGITCDTWMTLLDHQDLDRGWRGACYDPWNIAERCSIVSRYETGVRSVSFFRRHTEPPFSASALAFLEAIAPLMIASVAHHQELTRMQRARSEGALKLSAVCEPLSRREREVIMETCLGLTNKEIARKLNLGLSSVITYKKRAYERLGITNRRDLVKAVLF